MVSGSTSGTWPFSVGSGRSCVAVSPMGWPCVCWVLTWLFLPLAGYENYSYYGAQNTSVTTGAAYGYGPASWEATKASDGLAAGGPALHMASYGPEPCTDNSDSLIAKINQRLDMMSKEGGRGGSSGGREGMQDRER